MPASLTTFVGRRTDLAAIQHLLDERRLITLTGPAGVGKTRLAIEVGLRAGSEYRDGAWLLELAQLHDPGLLSELIATTLRLPQRGHRRETLWQRLEHWNALLILDDCDALIDACSSLARELMRWCTCLTILATSRERLEVEGEQVWRVAPLAVPEPGASTNAARHSPAVALFVDRAEHVNRNFALTRSNVHSVVRLCQRLDGLPLAIELAAARMGSVAPETMLDLLLKNQDLPDGSRTATHRHRTIESAIALSYRLLSVEERQLFRRLGVFAGGFNVEAAEKIAAWGAVSHRQVSRLLAQLVGKSLLTPITLDGSSSRWRLLETVRAYALKRLDDAGELQATRRRHARHYAGLVRLPWSQPALMQPGTVDRVASEAPNIREALEWAALHDHEGELVLATLFGWLGDWRGIQSEARGWLRSALNRPGGSWRVRYGALRIASYLAWRQGDRDEALDLVRAQVDQARRGRNRPTLCEALGELGHRLLECGFRVEAEGPLAEARAIASELGDTRLQGDAEYFRCLGAIQDKDLSAASAHIQQCLDLGGGADLGAALTALTWVRLGQNNLEPARTAIASALQHRLDVGDHAVIATSLDVAAEVRFKGGDSVGAMRLAGAADGIRRRTGTTASLVGVASRKRWFAQTMQRMGPVAKRALEEGTGLTAHAAVQLATSAQGPTKDSVSAPAPLSPREREVIELMSEGMTNRQIARRLLVSARTVDAHLEHVRSKLGLASRVDITRWLLDPDGERSAMASRPLVAPGSR